MQYKQKRIEDNDVLFKRIRVFVLVIGILAMSFCVIKSMKAQTTTASQDAQFLINSNDPASPTPRYVLDKLNKHISNSLIDEQTLNQVVSSIADIRTKDETTTVAVLVNKVDAEMWLSKTMIAGMLTIIGKEFLEMFRNKKSSG